MRFTHVLQDRNSWQNRRCMGIARRKTQIRVASSSYSGTDERCGDNCGWIMLHGGKVAAAISDGMGKGEIAAHESERAVNAILPLLRAGMDPEMALQILNMLWSMSNRKELFPTMDLALLDPASRELTIYKIGAAPTVIVRAPRCRPGPPERIEILTAPAMPMGVSEYSEIPAISTLVMPGDKIVMMTDGVADSDRCDMELKWLQQLLRRVKSQNLQTVCDLIIREAALNYGSREKDDMTVVAMSV